ncbi:MAG: MATE family efflux transporter [Oscillospiraceae bacterium]|nr:MATE family efflux transporter [Oscillospiraceae bacterium]
MTKVTHVDSGPIGRTLLSFALPVLMTQLLQELYNAADCAVLGHFGGPNALAASGVAGLLLSVLINFFVGFSSGVTAVTAQQFGKGETVRLQRTMTSVFRLVLAAGLLLSAVGVASAGTLLRLLHCPAEVLIPATAYLRICACGVLAQLFYNVAVAVLRSLGDSRGPLLCFIGSVLTNLALDALLVIGLRMGVRGAALATIVSQWLLAALLYLRLRRLGDGFSLDLTGEPLPFRELLGILRIGLPAGMQALFMSISSLVIQTFINRFGSDAMAGMTLYAKLEGILYLPSFAYGIALTGFVGQNVGAGRTGRISSAVRLSLRLCWAVAFPLSLAITAAAPLLLRVFSHEPGILFNAREAVQFNLPFYVIYSMNQVYLGAIKGFGKTGWPMLCTLLCYAVFRVVWCLVMIPLFPTMRIVYLSYDISFFLMFALLLPAYRRILGRIDPLTGRKPEGGLR